MRIIQRFGRIDRIGSPNARIQLINFWPDITLDDYIKLKERVENRMVIADVAATGDDNVLTAHKEKSCNDIAYRKEQLRRLQDEVIALKDEHDIDSLFSGGHTSALVNRIAGLDDFELIAFIVVMDRRRHRGSDALGTGRPRMTPCFAYPPATRFGRIIPKQKIYQHAGRRAHPGASASAALKQRFIDLVEQIRRAHEFAPPTLNNLPYNTGLEFVCGDDFRATRENHAARSDLNDSDARCLTCV